MEALLNTDEVRATLRISRRTFELTVAQGHAPQHLMVGRQRRWRQIDVVDWIETRKRDAREGVANSAAGIERQRSLLILTENSQPGAAMVELDIDVREAHHEAQRSVGEDMLGKGAPRLPI
jgi:predicted DNA-binding transcriptional regulator AlpA